MALVEDGIATDPLISEKTRRLQEAAHAAIPGGSHTYAKGDDQYPLNAPPLIARGLGCHVWDPDGNEFIEYGSGMRAVTLGHAYPRVLDAVKRALDLGTNFTRPHPMELGCAETLQSCVPNQDMVKFAKNGSDATTAAVKLARAATGRDLVALCGDQPFFSTDDWFIGSTPMNSGIPEAIRRLTVKFRYNDLPGVAALFAAHKGQIAALILEPEAGVPPQPGYLAGLRALCEEHGAVLIFDETITGFRWHLGGAQSLYGVTPDLSVWGKAMGNGFAIAAVSGRRDIMDLGGIRHDKDRVFLLSTTHGAETHALAAAIATMDIYRKEPVVEKLAKVGERLRIGAHQAAERHDVAGFVEITGRPCNLMFATRDRDKKPSQGYRALFMQELIRRGVLGPSFVVSYSHSDADIDRTIDAVDGALDVYKRALDDGYEKHLAGRPLKPVFRARN